MTPIRTLRARSARESGIATTVKLWLVIIFSRIIAKKEPQRKPPRDEKAFFVGEQQSLRSGTSSTQRFMTEKHSTTTNRSHERFDGSSNPCHLKGTASSVNYARVNLEAQFCFPLLGGRQRLFLGGDRFLARRFHPQAFSRVEFDTRIEFFGNRVIDIDRFNRAFSHASGAIDAFIRVNYELTVQLVEAGNGADLDAISKFAA